MANNGFKRCEGKTGRFPHEFITTNFPRCPLCRSDDPYWTIKFKQAFVGGRYLYKCKDCECIISADMGDAMGMSSGNFVDPGTNLMHYIKKSNSGKDFKTIYMKIEDAGSAHVGEGLEDSEYTLDDLKSLIQQETQFESLFQEERNIYDDEPVAEENAYQEYNYEGAQFETSEDDDIISSYFNDDDFNSKLYYEEKTNFEYSSDQEPVKRSYVDLSKSRLVFKLFFIISAIAYYSLSLLNFTVNSYSKHFLDVDFLTYLFLSLIGGSIFASGILIFAISSFVKPLAKPFGILGIITFIIGTAVQMASYVILSLSPASNPTSNIFVWISFVLHWALIYPYIFILVYYTSNGAIGKAFKTVAAILFGVFSFYFSLLAILAFAFSLEYIIISDIIALPFAVLLALAFAGTSPFVRVKRPKMVNNHASDQGTQAKGNFKVKSLIFSLVSIYAACMPLYNIPLISVFGTIALKNRKRHKKEHGKNHPLTIVSLIAVIIAIFICIFVNLLCCFFCGPFEILILT